MIFCLRKHWYAPGLKTHQALVSKQDGLATSRGDIVRYLIALYKALGGGWQIRIGKNIIPKHTAETMRNRTDWGEFLQPVDLPAEIEQPPTGKDVKLFNKPNL
jgi:hypothetical protein